VNQQPEGESAMQCSQAQELLSDLLDVRRGETPPAEHPLSDAARRAALETHVNRCSPCREELDALSETGAAFAEFSVGEPSPQHFAEYPAKVREKLKTTPARVVPDSVRVLPKLGGNVLRNWRGWLGIATASAAAAMLTVALVIPFLTKKRTQKIVTESTAHVDPEIGYDSKGLYPISNEVSAPNPVETPKDIIPPEPELPHAPLSRTYFKLMFQDGDKLIVCPMVYDAEKRDELIKQLQEALKTHGSLTFAEGEATEDLRKALMGMVLRVEAPKEGEAKDCSAPVGLVVAGVLRGSPAEQSGLHTGDCIQALNDLHFDSNTIEETLKFLNALQNTGAGHGVTLDFWHQVPKSKFWKLQRNSVMLGQYEQQP